MRRKVDELKAAAKEELARIDAMGGAVAAIDYMKRALVESNTERLRRIEAGEQIVVGVNRWTETEASPLSAGEGAVEAVDPAIEAEQIERLAAWRAARDAKAVKKALAELERAAKEGRNVMEPSIACAKAGVTTGEWGATLRAVFGEYRAPTGVVARRGGARRRRASTRCAPRSSACRRGSAGASSCWSASPASTATPTAPSRSPCAPATAAWRWSTRASASRPAQIVRAAGDEAVHVVGLSILSGSHVPLVARGDAAHARGRPRRRAGGGGRHHPAGGRRRR